MLPPPEEKTTFIWNVFFSLRSEKICLQWKKMFWRATRAGRLTGRPRLGWAGRASQKSSFSTGFIRVCDLARCHVSFIYKPNAFLIILGSILRFGLQNHQNTSVFIRYFDQQIWMLQNALGPMLFWCFAKSLNVINFHWKPNAFWYFLGSFCQNGPKSLLKRQGL